MAGEYSKCHSLASTNQNRANKPTSLNGGKGVPFLRVKEEKTTVITVTIDYDTIIIN